MSFVQNHRGPFLFNVVRATASKRHPLSSEWLHGEVDGDDVVSLAHAYLTDPRDSVLTVHVWSVPEECYVGAVRKGDDLAAP